MHTHNGSRDTRAESISSDCISFYTQLRGRCRVEEGRSEQRIPWKRNGLDDSSSLLLFTRARNTYVLETGWIIFTSRYASTIERSMIKVKFGRSLSFPLKFFSFQFAGGKIGYGSVSFASDNARNRNPGFGEKRKKRNSGAREMVSKPFADFTASLRIVAASSDELSFFSGDTWNSLHATLLRNRKRRNGIVPGLIFASIVGCFRRSSFYCTTIFSIF